MTGKCFRGLLDLLDPMERKDTWGSLDQWDHLELVDSVEKLGQRYHLVLHYRKALIVCY